MAYGFSILTFAQLTQAEPWALELIHRQNSGLLLWPTRGQGVVNLHGKRRGFGAHNAIFIPQGQLWSIELGRQSIGQAIFLKETDIMSFPDRCQHLRIKDNFVQSELTALIDDLRRELAQDRPLKEEALTMRGQMLSIWLRRQMLIDPAPIKRKASDRLIEKYCDIVSIEFKSGSNMADLAAKLDVTPTHLARVSRECCGLTAAEILTQCTLYEARRKLAQPKGSIKDIALDLGFSSPAYFTRFIQQHCGKSPSQLRNR